MRPCTVIRDDGSTVPAFLIRMGPKNSRISFNGNRDSSELVATERIFEIIEPSAPKPGSTKPYLDVTTQAAELGNRMEAMLTAAGVTSAEGMDLQDKFVTLCGLRDNKLVIIDGVVWNREEAVACGALEPTDSDEHVAEEVSAA